MSDYISTLPTLLKAPVAHSMAGDVAVLVINDIVAEWDTYALTIDVQTPGEKVSEKVFTGL